MGLFLKKIWLDLQMQCRVFRLPNLLHEYIMHFILKNNSICTWDSDILNYICIRKVMDIKYTINAREVQCPTWVSHLRNQQCTFFGIICAHTELSYQFILSNNVCS